MLLKSLAVDYPSFLGFGVDVTSIKVEFVAPLFPSEDDTFDMTDLQSLRGKECVLLSKEDAKYCRDAKEAWNRPFVVRHVETIIERKFPRWWLWCLTLAWTGFSATVFWSCVLR